MAVRRLPPLHALRAFESAARLGSIKSAADELCVTPAAVSQQIKKLENDVSVCLFIRNSRSIELTPAGRGVFEGLSSAFNEIRQAIDSAKPQFSGRHLHISCPPQIATKWLAPRLRSFTEKHPFIDLHIGSECTMSDNYAHCPDLEISIKADHVADNCEIFATEVFVPMANPYVVETYDVDSAERLIDAPLLSNLQDQLYQPAPTWSDWFERNGLSGLELTKRMVFGDRVDHAIEAAGSGLGVLLGPKVLASKEIQRGTLITLEGFEIAADLHYVVASNKHTRDTAKVNYFKDWLRSEA